MHALCNHDTCLACLHALDRMVSNSRNTACENPPACDQVLACAHTASLNAAFYLEHSVVIWHPVHCRMAEYCVKLVLKVQSLAVH